MSDVEQGGESEPERVIILGGGVAAYTAGIYAGRAQLRPLILESSYSAATIPGGQLMTTTDVENFPGFPSGINGPELVGRMREQAEHCGAVILSESCVSVSVDAETGVGGDGNGHGKVFRVKSDAGKEYVAYALIVATGAMAKRLNVPGEATYWNNGISACAVCDGALPLFRKQVVVCVGGGDTAMEEALFLSKYASQVILVHRRDVFRASQVMQRRVLAAHPKITVLWDSEVVEAHGDGSLLTAVSIRNVKTHAVQTVEAKGLFYAIGHSPNAGFVQHLVRVDDAGYIVTERGSTRTSFPGVFAAGDVQDKTFRQAVVAAGSGCMAAMETEHYLVEIGHSS
eukprot:ANDGO_06490.mRNA.1 Thioredoxin reductase 2